MVFVSGDYHLSTIADVKFKAGDCNTELTAWSIVVPPFYAPIPFANLPAGLVNRTGTRTTVNGNHMCYTTAAVDTRSGYADIRINRAPGAVGLTGAWKVGMTFMPVL